MTNLLGYQYRVATEIIEIDVTYLCNLRCNNCNRSSAQAPESAHIGLDAVRQFVDDSLLAGRNWSRIRLLGGEPTLHPDFMAILDELARYRAVYPDTSIQLVTNGYGPKVKRILQSIPKSIYVENSSKNSDVQPGFGPFNLAPQDSIAYSWAAEAINRCKRHALVDGIKYQRIGEEHFYAQELFEQEELTGYLKNMLLNAERSVYEHVVCDSDTERTFAEQLEKSNAVKVYAKLPGWFKVPTPLGTYNPDWAVLIERDGTERLYFVVETKSSLFTGDLRDKESDKITCGKAHFQALHVGENPATYQIARTLDDVLTRAFEE